MLLWPRRHVKSQISVNKKQNSLTNQTSFFPFIYSGTLTYCITYCNTYSLIRDADFFQWQEDNMEKLLARDPQTLRYAVKRSCENKAIVVKADEKEAGVRATLNLGHTFGHAIENGSGYGTYLHGEAVAIGTAMAASMSGEMGWIDESLVQGVYDILLQAKLPVSLPVDSPMNRENFLDLMSVDKKVADGQLRLILLKGKLGECVFTGDFDKDAMVKIVDAFVAECAGGSDSS
jgi:3-dehydroquinate synthase